jgi:hypothetical protein
MGEVYRIDARTARAVVANRAIQVDRLIPLALSDVKPTVNLTSLFAIPADRIEGQTNDHIRATDTAAAARGAAACSG